MDVYLSIARIWGPDVDELKLERFSLVYADKLPANAWRPFERGPRNCFGQELALIETKVVLAVTLREFQIGSAFDELETRRNDGTLWTKETSCRKGPKKVFCNLMYG